MGLRPFSCYRDIERPYTRKSKFKRKSFIKAVPEVRIVKFDMGDPKRKFPYVIYLKSKQDIQIRQNAIEATRMYVNKKLESRLGSNYYFKIRIYPHHVLRENKMLTGAGADRMQTGMQLSFGKPVGLAAQVKKGQIIFSIACEENAIPYVKEVLRAIFPKLPCKCSVEVEKLM